MNWLTKLGFMRQMDSRGRGNGRRRSDLPIRELGAPIAVPGVRTEGLQGYRARRLHLLYCVHVDRLMRVLTADAQKGRRPIACYDNAASLPKLKELREKLMESAAA